MQLMRLFKKKHLFKMIKSENKKRNWQLESINVLKQVDLKLTLWLLHVLWKVKYIFILAATYGKAFLPPNMIQNNQIYDTSKTLRIVHSLRNKHRYITFEQFESLSNDNLLKLLLRYREHYLAYEVYQYLKKDQNFRVKIYTDWACCKV